MSEEHGKFATAAIHAGQEPEKWTSWAVCPPISLATTFKQPDPGVTKAGFEYSRGGNPTRNSLEEAFAAICHGKKALVWASGLAGTNAVLQLLRPNDHVLAIDDLYGGTNRLLRRLGEPMGIQADFVPTADVEHFTKAMKPNTKLVWIESPTNPLLQVTDIRSVVSQVKAKNPKCIVVVDNTFTSAYFQRPLDLGADIEFASVTKYYNGHSDVLMGVTITKDADIAERLEFVQFAAGAVPGPFDCYLVNRGLKTLHVRMAAHAKNAIRVARYLEGHPKVRQVIYPGLKSHPGYEIAKRQCSGFSGMVTFRIRGDLESSRTFLKSIKVFTLAESLGAVESLAELPCIMTHASVPAEQRAQLGITDDLLRLSVGIEDIEDLIKDLEQALNAAVPGAEKTPDVAAFITEDAAKPEDAAPAADKPATAANGTAASKSGPRVSASTRAPVNDQDSRPGSRRHPPGGRSSITFG